MSEKKFDDLFKQSFSDYSPEVPAHIWENIAGKKRKKRAVFFWINDKKVLLVLAAMLIAVAGIYVATDTENDTKNIALENNGSRQGTENTVPAAVLKNSKEKTIKATGNDNNAVSSMAENNTTVISVKEKEVIQSASVAENKNAINIIAGNNSKTAMPVYSKENNNNGNIIAVSAKGKHKFKRTGKLTHTITNANPADMDVAGEEDEEENTTKQDELYIHEVEGSRDRILLSIQSLLPKQTIKPAVIKMPEDCPGNTSGNNYYFEAYISPDYAIKKYSDTGNSVLVAKRKESLRIQSAFSAGLRYTRVFANGMSVRTGFNFSQVNEKLSYAQDNIVQIVYIINNAGDTTDSYYVRGTRYKNSYNRYRTIDVPLVVGYEMGNGRFHTNINAGAVVNLYSWQKGETLDNNGAPVSITTGKEDNPYQYKTNVGIGFTAAASLYYKLNGQFHLLAEPYFRYNFSPMNKEALSIQERFTTIGLRFGIRMDIK